MALPTYVVEIQFGSSSWVDVSQYVQSVSISRGINRVLEDYSAGSLNVVFVNNSRVFDPLNTSSPLWDATNGYTLVQPGGNIRVSANGLRKFTGFIQDWQFSYDDAGFNGKALVTALDEIYKISNAALTGGEAWRVEATSNRIRTVLGYTGFTAGEYAGVTDGQTLLGTDSWTAGNSVLSYIQQVARSEPGDLYSNASAIMVFKDRSFTDYNWSNSMRYNFVSYPSTATTTYITDGGLADWNVLGTMATATASQFGGTVWRGGSVTAVDPAESFVGFDFQDFNAGRYANNGSSYVFSAYVRGVTGTYDGFFQLFDTDGLTIASTAVTAVSTANSQWVRVGGVVSSTAVLGGAGLLVAVYGATTYTVAGEGFQIEPGTAFIDYFDGGYSAYTDTASNRYRTAWGGSAYASTSGLLSSTASTVAPATILTFADANSQGVAYGNGTGIPFTDLQIQYGSEQLYNQVQVIGVNATATSNDTTGQSRYGLRTYSQTDNLTTSLTAPSTIAADLLAEFRLPEYRAEAITIALESLSATQQNQVLAVELRDVVRLCFQPSATGSVVDKYYQVLGIDANTDVERDQIIFRLASLDNLPFRLDSLILGVLDTDTLG